MPAGRKLTPAHRAALSASAQGRHRAGRAPDRLPEAPRVA